jgi:hypothetical protein
MGPGYSVLTDRVISAEQGKPVALPGRGKFIAMDMAMRVKEMGASEGCPVIGQIEVASPGAENINSPETELTSRWCSTRELLRNRCMKQSK